MGKAAEKGTPKDIAKRIKAKGLQKLKFWCQVCQKQCRDANGFKCHLESESHLRQIKLFSEAAGSHMSAYSREFERTFLACLRTRHTTMEVNANNVYQEVISDRTHTHMNATIWASLSDFVKYLGKTGKCHVRETDRGWYISYIEQDAHRLLQQEKFLQRQAAEEEAEHLATSRLELQRMEASKALDRIAVANDRLATNLDRSLVHDNNNESTIKISIRPPTTTQISGKKQSSLQQKEPINFFGGGDDEDDEDDIDNAPIPPPSLPDTSLPPRQLSNVSKSSSTKLKISLNEKDLLREANKTTEPLSHTEIKTSSGTRPWLLSDILVRIIDVKSEFYERKAVVNAVSNYGTTATVMILDSGPLTRDGGQVVNVPAHQLETVVSKIGKNVMVLTGMHRGKRAKIIELNPQKFRATLQLEESHETLNRVRYDDFSKAA